MSICFILSGHMGERGEKKREQTVLRPGDVALNASFAVRIGLPSLFSTKKAGFLLREL